MTASYKIATVITPFFIKKPDRNHLKSILDGLIHLGVVLRSNGNGGSDNVVNSVPDSEKLFYLPKDPFYSLTGGRVTLPNVHTEADAFLSKIFKGYNKYSEDSKMNLRASLYSLAGTKLNAHSNVALVLRTTNYAKHPYNHDLYKGAIRIAHELGIHVVNINSRIKEVTKNDTSTKGTQHNSESTS